MKLFNIVHEMNYRSSYTEEEILVLCEDESQAEEFLKSEYGTGFGSVYYSSDQVTEVWRIEPIQYWEYNGKWAIKR